jgi:hypothetical protein
MHAALVTLTVDPAHAPAAASALTNDILPMIQSAPGFVAGYWLEPDEAGKGFSIVLFDTEEEARQATPPASDWSAPGVSIDGVDIRRVAVSIP